MKRSNLKNIANKSGKTEDKKRYKIQQNAKTVNKSGKTEDKSVIKSNKMLKQN